jgi:origin recognition complex subunit 1
LYITVGIDESPIEAIKCKAIILTEKAFNSRFPAKKISRQDKEEYNRTFICRRGCNTGTTTYTEELNWDEIEHKTDEDIEKLIQKLTSETVSRKRGRKPGFKVVKRKKEDYLSEEDEDFEDDIIKTPRKKQKHSAITTPRKPKTPTKLLTPSHKRYTNCQDLFTFAYFE